MDCLKKLFFSLYPSKPIELNTPEGFYLRRVLLITLYLDITFFVLSELFVGFEPMIYAILFAAIAYSCYLTMKQFVIFLYVLLLGVEVFYGLFDT